MAFFMNHIELAGRLTHDPEYSEVESQSRAEPIKRCKFSVAVTRRRFKPDQDPETDFFNVTAWGKKAEVIARHFRKGDPIFVIGEMQCSRYTDKDGNKREGWTVELQEFHFVESKKNDPQAGEAEVPQFDAPEELQDTDQEVPW